MYYVIRNIDTYDVSVKKFQTLSKAAEWAILFNDNNSIIAKDIEKIEVASLSDQEPEEPYSWSQSYR